MCVGVCVCDEGKKQTKKKGQAPKLHKQDTFPYKLLTISQQLNLFIQISGIDSV